MDYRDIHKALLNPAAYPEETGEISFCETHISRLYFTDRHVYKIKKPVDFGFLNFTTSIDAGSTARKKSPSTTASARIRICALRISAKMTAASPSTARARSSNMPLS